MTLCPHCWRARSPPPALVSYLTCPSPMDFKNWSSEQDTVWSMELLSKYLRYNFLILPFNKSILFESQMPKFAYKYWPAKLLVSTPHCKPIITSLLDIHDLNVGVLWIFPSELWLLESLAMEKGKGKLCFGGYGACGKTGHVFKDCPHKNAHIPTLHITLKKPSTKGRSEEESNMEGLNNEEWSRGGVEIIYESEESEDGIQCYLQEQEVPETSQNLISIAADLHPYNLMNEKILPQNVGINGGNESDIVQIPLKTMDMNPWEGNDIAKGNESVSVQTPQKTMDKNPWEENDKETGECSRIQDILCQDSSKFPDMKNLSSREPTANSTPFPRKSGQQSSAYYAGGRTGRI